MYTLAARRVNVAVLGLLAAMVLAVTMALVPGPAEAATNLISNGGFETGTTASWTINSGDVDVVHSSEWQPSEGSYSLDLNGFFPGSISQSFPTFVGHNYELVFDLAGNPGNGGGVVLQVSAAGQSATPTFATAGRSATNMGWWPETFNFTANSNTTTLTFTSLTTGPLCLSGTFAACGPALDNIRVFALPVVYTSGSHVDTWNAIVPPNPQDPNWPSTICVPNPAVGLDAPWTNPHKAFVANGASFQSSVSHIFTADWINAWPGFEWFGLTSQYGGPPGDKQQSWTRYSTPVSGNGDFILYLAADNCSWIYISNADGSDPQLVGVQLAAPWTVPITYPVTLSGNHKLDFIVFDGGGQSGGMFRLETNSEAILFPTVAADNASVTVNQPAAATNTGTYSDGGAGANVGITASVGSVTKTGTNNGTWSWSKPTTSPPFDYDVTITATNASNGTAAFTQFHVHVLTNTPPTCNNDAFSMSEDATVSRTPPCTDPNGDPIQIEIVSLNLVSVSPVVIPGGNSWNVTPGLNYNGPASYTYKATDNKGATSNVATATITVDAVNDPPTINRNSASVTVNEGQTANNSGTYADVDNTDAQLTLSASIGTVTKTGPGAWSWSFNTTDGPIQTQVVTINVFDGVITRSTTFQLNVNNVAPIITSLTATPNTINEGQSTTLNGSFSDPGAPDKHTVIINWDDGSPNTVLNLAPGVLTFSANHTYVDNKPGNAPYTVSVTVTDKDGGSSAGGGGHIVVNHDEWTIAEQGFNAIPGAAGVFAKNIASWFTGGGTGNFLVYSNNFGLVGPQLANTMTGAGHTWTVNTGLPFTLATLQQYDGVFLAAWPHPGSPNQQVLIDYVNAGGNVYLGGGTGCCGGAGGEAAIWNTFLGAFGLQFQTSGYNGICCVTPVNSTHVLASGLTQLYFNNGSSVFLTGNAGPSSQVIAFHNGIGILGVYGSQNSVPVHVNNVAPVVNAGPDATINEGQTYTNAPSCAGAVTDPSTSHRYLSVSVPGGLTWPSAHAAAQALICGGSAGHLVTITSGAEQSFLNANLPPATFGVPFAHGYWIGGTWVGSGFGWVTGEPFVYTNWNAGEPNGDGMSAGGAIHFFGVGSPTGKWNDVPGSGYFFTGYVVEFDGPFGGSFTDPGADSPWTGTVNYGDGTGTQPLPINQANKSFTLSHQYNDNGIYNVNVCVTDKDGAQGCDTVEVTVNNVAPTSSLSNSGPITEGSSTTINFGPQFDPSSRDIAAGLHFAFDCNGGDLLGATYAGSGTNMSTDCWFNDAGSHTVKGRIIDKDGGSTLHSTIVQVNLPPTPDFSIDYDGPEGCICTPLFMNTQSNGAEHLFFKASGASVDLTVYAHSVNNMNPENLVAQVYDTTTNGLVATLNASYPAGTAAGTEVSATDSIATVAERIYRIKVTTPSTPSTQPHWRAVIDGASQAAINSPTWASIEADAPVRWFFNVNGSETLGVRWFSTDVPTPPSPGTATVDTQFFTPVGAASTSHILTAPVPPGIDQTISPAASSTGQWNLRINSNTFTPSGGGVHYRLQTVGLSDAAIYLTPATAGYGSISGTVSTSGGAPFPFPVQINLRSLIDNTIVDNTTSAGGSFSFFDVFVGDYRVEVVLPPGTNIVGPSFFDIFVACDEDSAVDFIINRPPKSIAGFYFVDEGGSVALNGQDGDPDGNPVTYIWDLDNDGVFETPGQNPVFSAAGRDGPDDQPIKLRVCDGFGGCAVSSGNVHINNVAPTITNITLNGASIDENGSVTLNGSFTDPGLPDTFTVVINWGLGQGSTTLNLAAGQTTFSASHQYLDDNPTGTASDVYNVGVTVSDDDTGLASAGATVTVNNVAPSITSLTAANINEGQSTTLNVSFSDPGTQDIHTVTIDWGDGKSQTMTLALGARSFSAAHSYPDDNPTGTPSDLYTITVTVADDDTGSDTEAVAITVSNVAPANVSLNVSPASINENDSVTLSGSFTDPGVEDTHTVVINWGDGSANTTLTLSAGVLSFSGVTHQYLDDGASPGNGTPSDTHTISVTVTDDDTGTGSASTSVTVNNVAPQVTVNGPFTINENGSVTVSGAVTDAGTLDAHIVVISWGAGEGSTTLTLPAGVLTYSASHQYLDDNPTGTASDVYAVNVTVTDDDTGTGSASTSVTVKNVSPVVNAGADQNVLIGTPLNVSASFTDIGTQDTWTYSIDWGDGSPVGTGNSTAGVPITGSHLYVVTGPRTVTICVTDDDTGSHCDSLVVDFLSGTGKITAGVLRFGNNGRGGFNVQSDKNGTVKGELQYHNGSDNLHAHTLTHIAVYDNNTKGWFAGVLTDGRTFVAYVEDNGEPGKNDVFKMWVEGVLLNGDGKLTGGNVQIHK